MTLQELLDTVNWSLVLDGFGFGALATAGVMLIWKGLR